MHTQGGRHAGRQIEHVAVSQQLLRAHLVENGARVDLGRYLECDPTRNIGLDEPGDDVDRRALRGKDQVNAGSACLLREACDQFLDLLAGDHHEIGQLIDDHHDQRQRFQCRRCVIVRRRVPQRIGNRLALLDGIAHLAVETADIAHAQHRHDLIAALHLGHAPAKRVGRVAQIGHDRREQLRDAVIDGQLQHLRINHDETHIARYRLVEQAQHHGVERDGLARPGRAGNQQMWHSREVHHDGIARDVLAERESQRGGILVVARRFQYLAQAHELALLVRDLEADDRFARDYLHDAHADRRQGACQVLGQSGDATHLDARRKLELETRDDGTGMHGHDFRLDPEVLELELDLARKGLQRHVGNRRGAARGHVEQCQRRQSVSRRWLEQYDLLVLLCAHAGLELRYARLDAHFPAPAVPLAFGAKPALALAKRLALAPPGTGTDGD